MKDFITKPVLVTTLKEQAIFRRKLWKGNISWVQVNTVKVVEQSFVKLIWSLKIKVVKSIVSKIKGTHKIRLK